MDDMTIEGRADRLLDALGVVPVGPRTVPFDPGYDPSTVVSHIEQSGHLMAMLKLSMATWMVSAPASVARKIAAAHAAGVRVDCGGGPFEVACASGELDAYLDLCAAVGMDRIEAGEGFTTLATTPEALLAQATSRGLEVQYELGRKHTGPFDAAEASELVETGKRWLGAGAVQLVVEGRESAQNVGLFGDDGCLNTDLADIFVAEFGIDTVIFEAPTKASQFAMIAHFGREVWLTNVRLEELLRVEIYRRGLHSDAYGDDRLRPTPKKDTHP
jgi:phosphosulfolactate synthase